MCPGFGLNSTRDLESQSMKSSCMFYVVWFEALPLHWLELGFENES